MAEPPNDSNRPLVLFHGQDGNKEVACAISEEALAFKAMEKML